MAGGVMTERPVVASAYPGYATPTFVERGGIWLVTAQPWDRPVGAVWESGLVGWSAGNVHGLNVGLFPDKQAAGEALVRHAGYEVLG